MKTLIDSADLEVQKNGGTALFMAAENGHLDVVSALITSRARLDSAAMEPQRSTLLKKGTWT